MIRKHLNLILLDCWKKIDAETFLRFFKSMIPVTQQLMEVIF